MTHLHIVARQVNRFYVLDLFLFHWESGTLFGPVFRRMTHIQTTTTTTKLVFHTNEEQKEVDSDVLPTFATRAVLFMTLLIQSAGHKMAARQGCVSETFDRRFLTNKKSS